jgi:hypothetical protein
MSPPQTAAILKTNCSEQNLRMCPVFFFSETIWSNVSGNTPTLKTSGARKSE